MKSVDGLILKLETVHVKRFVRLSSNILSQQCAGGRNFVTQRLVKQPVVVGREMSSLKTLKYQLISFPVTELLVGMSMKEIIGGIPKPVFLPKC